MTTPSAIQPFMFLSDAITSTSGLARIHRDTVTRAHTDPSLSSLYRFMAYGIGGPISSSSRFPFPNQSVRQLDRMIPMELPQVWTDFAGQYGDGRQDDSPQDLATRRGMIRKGVLAVIWNASWCAWLSHPEYLPLEHPLSSFLLQRPRQFDLASWRALTPQLRAQLAYRPFSRWLYCPVDGHCEDGTMGWQMADILTGFDRVLAYTEYGAGVIERTVEKWGGGSVAPPLAAKVLHLPHGLTPEFQPRDRRLARETLVSRLTNGEKSAPLREDQMLVFCIATNTSRKDWGLAFQTCAELLRRGRNVYFWGHTDCLAGQDEAHWNLPTLAKQYGLYGNSAKDSRVMLTCEQLTDEDLSWAVSACDIGLHIGAGEGWGYFGMQTVACGVPVVHGNYAGGVESVPSCSLVDPVAFTIEKSFFIQRPVFRAVDWADRVEWLLRPENRSAATTLPQELKWDGEGGEGEQGIWKRWREWLANGRTGDLR